MYGSKPKLFNNLQTNAAAGRFRIEYLIMVNLTVLHLFLGGLTMAVNDEQWDVCLILASNNPLSLEFTMTKY